MSYQINYGETNIKKPSAGKIVLIVSCCVIAGVLFWPAGRGALREALLPGDAEVTSAALQGLAEDLTHGEDISDAVTAFCQEIIVGGE